MQHIPGQDQDASILHRKPSPPPSPPSPDTNSADNELLLPRKREREVSLEPATSPRAISDTARTPAKKNRIQPGETLEEANEAGANGGNNAAGSRSRTPSPPLAGSPPHEFKVKVRQISQGVEDLTWKKKNTNATMAAARDIEEEEKESSSEEDKNLKRRATSAAPHTETESNKRPRDDPDKDDNPRETKRPSPPPDKEREKEIEEAKRAAAKPSGFLAYTSTSLPFKSATTSATSEPNRPSTPPSQEKGTQKMSGFMAYASASSPFASVKGPSIFSSSPSRNISPFITSQSSSSMTPSKRSGFEAFASSDSPFAQATRSKSPVLGSSSNLGRSKSPTRRGTPANANAFSSYASAGTNPFMAHKRAKTVESVEPSPPLSERSTPNGATSQKRADEPEGDEDSEENEHEEGSFGARLRASKDEESTEEAVKTSLTEQDVVTGEEDEDTIHQIRGKLYALDGNQWKERGTGMLKLNVRRQDGERPRLVMRKEAVYTILLNVPLFKGMKCAIAQDPRYIRLSVIENGATNHYNVRVGSAKAAEDMLRVIDENIPGDTSAAAEV